MEVGGLADIIDVYIDSMLLIATPRLRTLVAGLTLTVWRSSVLVELSARCRALVPIMMASVWLGFTDKPL